jgi:tetratricopeptide (TPR) repeat protein
MVKVNLALQLLRDRRFNESVEAYRRQLSEGSDEWGNTEGLGHALMAAGEFAEAIPYLDKVSKYASSLYPGALGRQPELSVCHWMIGDRDRGLRIIRDLVVAVRDRKIGYADISGGVPYGLILCYMAITLGSKSDVDLAMKYLKKISARAWIENWPGPVAKFLLGGLTFGEALKEASGSADLAGAKKWAAQDSWGPRRLAPLLFAAGTERRMAGDEAGCRMFMTECASLRNPLVEYEWYLAKSEATSPS